MSCLLREISASPAGCHAEFKVYSREFMLLSAGWTHLTCIEAVTGSSCTCCTRDHRLDQVLIASRASGAVLAGSSSGRLMSHCESAL